MPLTERDKAILEFEGAWWIEPGTKRAAIRERFGLSATRYYQILGELLSSAAALDHSPLVVRRMRREREHRRRQRYDARPASDWSANE